jgi:GDP-mannose 6-dehydrogenase
VTTVSIFGLGYVGSVSAACLADNGLHVLGVDVNPVKVDAINAGRSPVVEDGLDELLARGVAENRIRALSDVQEAVEASDASLICVGTPSNPNGSLDLSAVERVAQSIGLALASKDSYHVVCVRSTMLPGSTEERVIPVLEKFSTKGAGVDFGVCYNPEFLREGSSIRDFHRPPFTIIGGPHTVANKVLAGLYAGIDAPVVTTSFRVAEMLKYASNAYHALKIVFANEIGALCKEQGIDSHELMDLFSRDTKLNISAAYLKPGYAFGGSCLPKDLRAVLYQARRLDLHLPVLEAILASNDRQIQAAYEMIQRTGKKRVGVLGLSFKAGTDDLRESPIVTLVERLIGRGYDVVVYDRSVSFANLQGANRAYIEHEIPHIVSIMTTSLEGLLDHAEVVVIGSADPEFTDVVSKARDGQEYIDLIRVGDRQTPDGVTYQGIGWYKAIAAQAAPRQGA